MSHYLSWWEKSILLRPFDFAVLGAGLIGKQIAIKIKSKYPQARVALIDRSAISYGASTRNAGFACSGSVTEILDDFTRSEKADVIKLAAKRYTGIQQLIAEFGRDQIGYRGCGSYEVFTNSDDRDKALSEYQNINAMLFEENGMKEVFNLQSTSSLKMHFEEQCLFNPYEGMLNSGMLNEVISEKAHRLSILPLYGLHVKAYESNSAGYVLHTEQGIDIDCKQLIIANNAFAKDFLPEEDIEPARGQIIITKPLENIPFDGIFHSDQGYIYFRNVGDRILLGGGRNHFYQEEHTFDMQGSTGIRTYLEQYLQNHILPGQVFETDMHWSGIMAMGKEKMPIVKRVNPRLILCVRMSGMGVALGPVLSDEVLDLIS